MNFRKGDYIVAMNQVANRFLIETLEPQAEDSYFTWNFLMQFLGRKKGTPRIHSKISPQTIWKNPELKTKLEQRRNTDTAFAKNGDAQLNFVFQNSTYFEPVNMRYPVYRVLK